jgi:hypothetical protein
MHPTAPTSCPTLCNHSASNNSPWRRQATRGFFLFGLLLLLCKLTAFAELKPQTRQAFEHYVRISEQRISSEEASDSAPLLIDDLSQHGNLNALGRVRNGEVVVESRLTREDGQPIMVPDGMVHHWVGIVFVPGLKIRQTLELLQDYDNHDRIYAPDVERSKLIKHDGDDFQVYYRLRRQKIITVVMDAYYDVHYGPVRNQQTWSRSHSTKIQEVSDPGQKNEKDLPPDGGAGYMWRLNTYWRFVERDGGIYIQCEAISLSRSIPMGLGALIGPYVESVPRESLVFTLGRTREQLLKGIR